MIVETGEATAACYQRNRVLEVEKVKVRGRRF